MSTTIKMFLKKKFPILKLFSFLLLSPVIFLVLNLMLNTILNLGTYFGTFLRYVYEFIVY